MFGNHFFNDPFFNYAGNQFMMNDPFMAQQPNQHNQGHQSLLPFGGMGMGMGGMPDMFSSMNQMMRQMESQMMNMQTQGARTPGNGHFYSSSSFYSYDGRNGSEPHVYQAHSSTMTGPDGVRATRKAVSDSRTGEEKMAVGQHIGERGYVREKRRNRRTNDEEELEELDGMDHDELDSFKNEWHSRAGRMHRAIGEDSNHRRRHDRRAVTDGRRH